MLDFDDEGEVIGTEILYVSQRMAKPKAAAWAPGRRIGGDEQTVTVMDE
jgi:hypothetical protein